MKLYVLGRLYSPQNKPDLRRVMQSYEQITLSIARVTRLVLLMFAVGGKVSNWKYISTYSNDTLLSGI